VKCDPVKTGPRPRVGRRSAGWGRFQGRVAALGEKRSPPKARKTTPRLEWVALICSHATHSNLLWSHVSLRKTGSHFCATCSRRGSAARRILSGGQGARAKLRRLKRLPSNRRFASGKTGRQALPGGAADMRPAPVYTPRDCGHSGGK